MESPVSLTLLLINLMGPDGPPPIQGDEALQEFLRPHMAFLSPPIRKWQGVLLDSVDTFVAAYFPEPESALRAAMGLQEHLARQNRKAGEEERVFFAMGVHMAEGLLKENSVTGKVWDQAVKMMSGAPQDRIRVSQSAYEPIKHLPDVRFAACAHVERGEDTRGFTVYEATRQTPSPPAPDTSALLFLRPLQDFRGHGLEDTWEQWVEKKSSLWEGKGAPQQVLEDKTVVLGFRDGGSAIAAADRVIATLREKGGGEGDLIAPVQAVIDCGPLPASDAFEAGPEIDWEAIPPGAIHISSAAYGRLHAPVAYTVERDVVPGFHRLIPKPKEEAEPKPLFHTSALIHGEYPPCYYCGDRRHEPSQCPSKKLLPVSEGLEKAGYLSPQRLQALIQDYIKGERGGSKSRRNDYGFLSKIGFYDLKRIFQLRFFRSIWGWEDGDWETLVKRERGRDTAGFVWEALEALRASNPIKAGKRLNEAPGDRFHRDFRASCVSGFLEMEQESFRLSESHFLNAAERTKTTPQKIFVLFQLFRLADVRGNPIKAESRLEEILRLNSECPEALYHEAMLKFRNGQDREALAQLRWLIREDRAFYIRAWIDPDLSPFAHILHPALAKMLKRAQEKAAEVMEKARAEVERLKDLIGSDTEEFKKPEALMEKIEALWESGSYFGYADIPRLAENEIFSMGQRIIEERKTQVFRGLQNIRHQCFDQLRFAAHVPHQLLMGNILNEVQDIWVEIDEAGKRIDVETIEGYQEILARIEDFKTRVNQTQHRMNKMHNTSRIISLLVLSLKYNLIFQAINLAIVFAVIPLLGHYAATLEIPGNEYLVQNTGVFQGRVFFAGGVFWILVSVVMAVKKVIYPGGAKEPLSDQGRPGSKQGG